RERTRAFIQRAVDAAGMDLPPGAAWLLVQGEERGGLHEAEAVAAERGLDRSWVQQQLAVLEEIGLVSGGELTDAGHAAAHRLLGRAPGRDAVLAAGDDPLPAGEAGEQPRVGRDRDATGLAGRQLDALEAQQAPPRLREVELGDLGAPAVAAVGHVEARGDR